MMSDLVKQGLSPGFALDITCIDEEDGTDWDLSLPHKQEKAMMVVQTQKPLFLIGSPCCRAFSTWQALNAARGDAQAYEEIKRQSIKHLEFVCRLYQEQIDSGRYFIHEHPEGASSWKEFHPGHHVLTERPTHRRRSVHVWC